LYAHIIEDVINNLYIVLEIQVALDVAGPNYWTQGVSASAATEP